MTLDLPQDVLDELPAPDEQGLVRVSVALRMGEDGSATVAEIADVPVDMAEDDEMPEPTPEQAAANFMM